MFRKMFCYCIILVIVFALPGCSKNYKASNTINNVQKNKTQTVVTPYEKNSNAANETYNLQDYLSQEGTIFLAGKIDNKLDIHMELKKTDKDNFDDLSDRYYDSSLSMEGTEVTARYEGIYYYDKYMKNIRVEAQTYSNGYINIFEFDEKNQVSGSFGGFIFQNKILKGMWSNNNIPKYQFYLVKSGAGIGGTNLRLDTNRIGIYSRIGSTADDSTTLTIFTVSDDKVKFHISGYSKPNIGNVGGAASYTDSSKKTAEFYDKKTNLKIIFKFNGKTVEAAGNDALNDFAGAHVTMSGKFIKK